MHRARASVGAHIVRFCRSVADARRLASMPRLVSSALLKSDELACDAERAAGKRFVVVAGLNDIAVEAVDREQKKILPLDRQVRNNQADESAADHTLARGGLAPFSLCLRVDLVGRVAHRPVVEITARWVRCSK